MFSYLSCIACFFFLSYGAVQNVASAVGVDAAFGHKITLGTVLGAAVTGALDEAIPQFKGLPFKKYNGWAKLANASAELCINTVRGGVLGGIGAAVAGESFKDGMESGAIGGFVRTSINIAILGPTIRPTGKIKENLQAMCTFFFFLTINSAKNDQYCC